MNISFFINIYLFITIIILLASLWTIYLSKDLLYVCMYICMYVCVCVLGNDGPLKITIYHVTIKFLIHLFISVS